jgi:hypothetical protein
MDRCKGMGLFPLFFFCTLAFLQSGCAVTGSASKAPVTPIFTAGSESARKQEFTLRQIKWQHADIQGEITGAQFFRDMERPIPGARERDTLTIKQGPYQGSYTVARVIRRRVGKKAEVFIKIAGSFPVAWKTIHSGNAGFSTEKNEFTDEGSFPPEVAKGARLVITLGPTRQVFTIDDSTIVQTATMRQQRVGYKIAEKLPSVRSASYEIQIPDPERARKIAYQIDWRGSSLTGRFYTIGINRRRYSEKELEDLLNSEDKSKLALKSAPAKQATAIVFQILGGLAVGVGGYLFLVNRDDFRNTEFIPLSIAGGGVLLIVAAIPLLISHHNDYLAAAEAYNKSLLEKLQLSADKVQLSQSSPTPKTSSPLSKSHTPAPATSTTILFGKQ